MMKGKKIESLTAAKKGNLEFLVEEFLEKDLASLEKRLKRKRIEAEGMTQRLDSILLQGTFWMDELYDEDHADTGFVKVLSNWHRLLKPLWKQIKKALFNFKEEILPARAAAQNDHEAIPQELQGLSPYNPYLMDKYYQINLRSGAISHVTMCFDAGRIDIYNRDYKIKNNFLDFLKKVPISIFGRCRHCGKCIVITRKDKEHCPGCAASRWQKDKWEEDPVASREKEKKRYQGRKKGQSR